MCLYLNTTFNVSKKLYCLFKILYLSVKVQTIFRQPITVFFLITGNQIDLRRKKRKRKKIEKRKSFRRAEVNTKNIKTSPPPPPPPPPHPRCPPPPPLVTVQKAAVRVTAKGQKCRRREERKASAQGITAVILKRRASLSRENGMRNVLAVTVTRKSLSF